MRSMTFRAGGMPGPPKRMESAKVEMPRTTVRTSAMIAAHQKCKALDEIEGVLFEDDGIARSNVEVTGARLRTRDQGAMLHARPGTPPC